MSKHKNQTLAQRRIALLARCAEQRQTLAFHAQGLEEASSRLDAMVNLLRRVRQHPVILVALVAAVLIIQPRRISRAARGCLTIMRAVSGIAPVVQRLVHQPKRHALH